MRAGADAEEARAWRQDLDAMMFGGVDWDRARAAWVALRWAGKITAAVAFFMWQAWAGVVFSALGAFSAGALARLAGEGWPFWLMLALLFALVVLAEAVDQGFEMAGFAWGRRGTALAAATQAGAALQAGWWAWGQADGSWGQTVQPWLSWGFAWVAGPLAIAWTLCKGVELWLERPASAWLALEWSGWTRHVGSLDGVDAMRRDTTSWALRHGGLGWEMRRAREGSKSKSATLDWIKAKVSEGKIAAPDLEREASLEMMEELARAWAPRRWRRADCAKSWPWRPGEAPRRPKRAGFERGGVLKSQSRGLGACAPWPTLSSSMAHARASKKATLDARPPSRA